MGDPSRVLRVPPRAPSRLCPLTSGALTPNTHTARSSSSCSHGLHHSDSGVGSQLWTDKSAAADRQGTKDEMVQTVLPTQDGAKGVRPGSVGPLVPPQGTKRSGIRRYRLPTSPNS